jgi:3-phenylpropionate/trans-cinnamate dioxygenase ferredoxin subunit
LRRVRVGAVGAFADGTLTPITLEGGEFVIARSGDRYYAFPDRCTHAKRTLSDGEWDGERVTCIHHGATFDLSGGGRATMPALRPLPCLSVHVDGGEVSVEFE